MKKISPDEILGLADYERVRNRLRPLFIHEKERRRLHVGSHLTFIFENAQTEWYQIEEMIRSEKMTDREAIQHEIDTYNELIPAVGELVATLLIEYAEAAERDAALARLAGLENHLWLKIGPKEDRGQIRRAAGVRRKNQRGAIRQIRARRCRCGEIPGTRRRRRGISRGGPSEPGGSRRDQRSAGVVTGRGFALADSDSESLWPEVVCVRKTGVPRLRSG